MTFLKLALRVELAKKIYTFIRIRTTWLPQFGTFILSGAKPLLPYILRTNTTTAE